MLFQWVLLHSYITIKCFWNTERLLSHNDSFEYAVMWSYPTVHPFSTWKFTCGSVTLRQGKGCKNHRNNKRKRCIVRSPLPSQSSRISSLLHVDFILACFPFQKKDHGSTYFSNISFQSLKIKGQKYNWCNASELM